MAIGGTVLSLVLGDRAAVLAQVGGDKAGRVVQRVGRFDAPGVVRLLDQPAEHGAALAAFLVGHGFTAKKAIVGVPARWLIAQERELPPVDASGAADLLRLAAERLSVAESGTLVADFAGVSDPKAATRVLLVGMLKQQIDRVRLFVEAAGLTLAAICPTSLAIARVAGGDASVLRLSDDGAELVLQAGGNPRTLQPLTADLAALGPEVRRTLALRGAASAAVVVADGVGLTGAQADDLAGRLGGPQKRFAVPAGIRVDPAAANGSAASLAPDAHWPAVALAVVAADRRGLPVDFIDTKLAVRPPSRVGRRTVLIAAVAVAAVAGFAWLVSTVNAREAEEIRLAHAVADKEPVVKDAKAVIDQINYGRTYFDARPPTLECLRQLTLAFNYEEPIWASSITYALNGRGQLLGKCLDERKDQKLIYALLDRVKANAAFKDAGLQSISESGGKEQLKSFSIGFVFQPTPATGAK